MKAGRGMKILIMIFTCSIIALIHIKFDIHLMSKKKKIKIFKNKVKSKERLKLALELSNESLWEWDHENKCFYYSTQLKELLGYNQNLNVGIKFIFKILHPKDRSVIIEKIRNIIAGKTDELTANVRLKCNNGKYKWILCTARALRNNKGYMVRIAGFLSNIDEIVQLTKEVEYEKEFLSNIFETAQNIMFVVDNFGRITSVSKHARNFFKFDTDHFKLEEIFLRNDKKKMVNYMKNINQYPEGLICKVVTKSGGIRSVLWQLSYILDTEDNRRILFIGIDITESEKNKKTIHELAYYDQLTELPNRQNFITELNKMIQQEDSNFAVLYIDLDNFKNINDIFGHSFGDKYLISIGQIIQDSINNLDGLAARLSGDEFAVILKNVSKEKVIQVSDEIKNRFNQQILVQNILMNTTASIGIAFFPQDAKNEQELLIYTDAAMYRAKQMGKNTVQFFNQDIYEEMLKKNILINQLKYALNNDKFVLYYQPIYNTVSNGISVVETLIRWEKNGKIISPDNFIPVSEETGLIVPIGYWILEKAFQQAVAWQNKGINVLLSINISWVQLKQMNFSKKVKELIYEVGVDPRRIIFEITEEIMFKMNKNILDTVKKIGQMGFKIALDDFGCEYSTLKLLSKIPINYLKLDKSNLKNVGIDNKDEKLIKELITLGTNLELDIIAEGVEKEEQLIFLKNNGCRNIQGYMISKPRRPEQIEQMLYNNNLLEEKKVVMKEYSS